MNFSVATVMYLDQTELMPQTDASDRRDFNVFNRLGGFVQLLFAFLIQDKKEVI